MATQEVHKIHQTSKTLPPHFIFKTHKGRENIGFKLF